jgi:hypothetical protein
MSLTLPSGVQLALLAAMDEVPMTAEQRRRLLEQFSLQYSGQQGGGAVTTPMAASAPVAASLSGPALADALTRALETKSAVSPAASTPAGQVPAATVVPAPQQLKRELEQKLTTVAAAASPAKVDHSAVQSLVRQTVVQQRRALRRSGMSVVRGFIYALAIGVTLALCFSFSFLGIFGMEFVGQPLVLTAVDIALVVVVLQLLGTLHEWLWASRTHFGILVTLIRGVTAPITVPFGALLLAHEWLWSDARESFLARLPRAAISPVSVPIGIVWCASGAVVSLLLRVVGGGSPVSRPALA